MGEFLLKIEKVPLEPQKVPFNSEWPREVRLSIIARVE